MTLASAYLHTGASRFPSAPLLVSRVSPSVPANLSYFGARRLATRPQRASLVRTTQLDKSVGQDAPEPDGSPTPEVEAFDWNKAWYPVAVEDDLNPLAPKRIQLLGREFVVWNEKGDWRCFENACPHRLAPLSEGRIEPSDGSLMCSYHGWRFNGQGECLKIPQLRVEAHEKGSPCKNPRSAVQTFPVKVHGEMIWVWPDDSPSAYIDSSMVEPYCGDIDPETTTTVSPLFMRELPHPVDIVVENILDPSHVPFSNHGVRGIRDTAGWMEAKLEKVPQGSKATIRAFIKSLTLPLKKDADKGKQGQVKERVLEFFEPSTAVFTFLGAGKPTGGMVMNVTPMCAEKSMIFFRVVVPRKLPAFAQFMLAITRPKWLVHLENNAVMDGDMVLLKDQTKVLRESTRQGKPWAMKFFVPSSADAILIKFRDWFHGKRGAGGPKLPSGEPMLSSTAGPPLDEETALDRYNTHTKHCKACSGAMKFFGLLERFANVVAAALGVSALLIGQALGKSGGMGWSLIEKVAYIGLGALVALYVSRKAKDMKQQFVYTGYNHWAKQ